MPPPDVANIDSQRRTCELRRLRLVIGLHSLYYNFNVCLVVVKGVRKWSDRCKFQSVDCIEPANNIAASFPLKFFLLSTVTSWVKHELLLDPALVFELNKVRCCISYC